MQKYFNNEELFLEDENIISGYLFFSNPELISDYNGDGPDFFTLNSIYIYGSGNFNEEEIEVIKQIDRRIKENKSRKN